ncbi:MAG: DHA2 family efflux MFS transporter permease subunit [Planctomycetes bacterium]|nr:DHA2 family efflux MFS transporter permease subunit [Planctomycetota bacterium]
MSASPDRPRARSPWLIAAVVTIPTFMEVLDTSIANVALRHIAGGLSAAQSDSEWIVTSYLAANAIVLPLSGWLINRFGRKRYFLVSLTGFTLSSFLCGIAGSLPELILFRVIQGLSGGGLQPCTQGVLLDTFPREKQGQAMTVFGMAALIAPVVGPTLGGYITDNYSWRWIFFINAPVGALAVLSAWALLEDPDYLRERRAEMRRSAARFDAIGLGLVVLGIASLEVFLSKGTEWDWFGDPFRRAHVMFAGVVLGIGGAIWWELRSPNPVVDLRPFANRNFLAAGVVLFCAYGVLYGSVTSLPGLLESLLGYDATHAGLVMSPAGLFAVVLMPVVGLLLTRGVDARWLIACGATLLWAGCYWMSKLTLDVGPWQVIWPRVVQTLGLTMMFAPLNVAAYATMDARLRPAAVGVFALLRNEGGSVGTSLATALRERRLQFHVQRLGEWADPLNPAVREYHDALRGFLMARFGDPAGADFGAWQVIENLRQQQALSLAYFDCFWAFGVAALLLVPLAFLMRPARAAKGEHVGAE